jgi:hypothetical protein
MSTTRVRRDDGATLELPSYVPFHRLPHDLAHFVVESALGLTLGFWGSIAHGAIFGGMQVVPRRRTAGAVERSRKLMKRANSQITEAEALVGTVVNIYQRRLDRDWTTARALLGGTWRPARPSRALPNQAEIRRICEALATAERRWLDLAVGESLILRWPQQRAMSRRRASRKASLAEQRISPDGRAHVRGECER